jgi:hypothetical protein
MNGNTLSNVEKPAKGEATGPVRAGKIQFNHLRPACTNKEFQKACPENHS